MKRVFQSIAILAALAFAAVACTSEALAPAEPSTPALTAPAISVTISNVTDDSFSFTVAPQGESSYYSYAVTTSPTAPSAAALYANSVTAIVKKAVKYSDQSSVTAEVTDLSPNTAYYVYAVASSKEGNVGEVASASTTTSDGDVPYPTDAASEENIVQIAFSENISYVEGKKVTAVVYAKLYCAPTDKPVIDETVAEVEVAGKVAQFTFPEITVPGSWYLVSYPAGTFIDSAGNPCPALTSAFAYDEEGEVVSFKGVGGYLENENFDFEFEAPATAANYDDFINVTSKQMLNGPGAEGSNASAVVVNVTDGITTTVEYPLQPGVQYGVTSLYTAGFRLKEAPGRGDTFLFNVEEAAFMDIYGNVNNEFSIGPILYSYGYTLDDFCGDYVFESTSAYASYGYGPYSDVITIAKSDKEDAGNVMFTGKLAETEVKFYGTADCDTGEIEVPGGQIVGSCYDYLYSGGNPVLDQEGNPIVIECDLRLHISNGSSYYSNALGFDFPASQTPQYWYPDYFVGLLELYNSSPYSWYDLIKISNITLKQANASSAAAPSPAGRTQRVHIGGVPVLMEKM